MVSVSNLSMHFGQQVLFEDVSFQLNPGQRVGLVGSNGSGKSTLMRILSGEIRAEEGEVNLPGGLKIGILRQDHYKFDDQIIQDVVIMGRPQLWEALKEKEQLTSQGNISEELGHRLAELEMVIADQHGYEAEAEAAELLAGLGVEGIEGKLSTLSGGYKLRVLLAQCLFGKPDFLLLDEPTNHLDLGSIAWLEGHLREFAGSLLVISHDRHFLDQVCTHILDIDYQTIRNYKGNYTQFVAAKALEREQKEAEIQRQEKKKEEIQQFVDRFKAKATKARQASSKAKQLDRMEEIVIKRSSRRAPSFGLQLARPSGKDALFLQGVNKSFGEKQVLNQVGLKLRRGERLAIIGPNGIGKSTLLKILAGDLRADEGEVKWGHEVSLGYFPQDHRDRIPMNSTPYEWLYTFAPHETIGTIRGLLGRMLLTGDDVHKKTDALSGGECARLIFAQIMLEKPNCLLIDEPTNHMDIETIEALAEALRKYEGTVLLVSHDRNFIEATATAILELKRDGYEFFPGNYQEYLEKQGHDYLDRTMAAQKPKKEKKKDEDNSPLIPDLTGRDFRQVKKDFNRLVKSLSSKEKKYIRLEEEMSQLDQKLATGELYRPGKEDQLRECLKAKEDLEEPLRLACQEWEDLQQKVDQLEKEFPGLREN